MPTDDESVTDESTEIDAAQDTDATDEVVEVDPDAGAKKALVAERTARKTAEKELQALKAQLADKDKSADEQAVEERIRTATTEATSKANERLIRAEVRAAATGKVKNPALALKLIDTSGIDVDDDGEVDSDALQAAISDLLTEYPELAADASRFGGGADQGAKGKGAKPAQLSEQDLNSMTPEQISEARASGRLDRILGVKN